MQIRNVWTSLRQLVRGATRHSLRSGVLRLKSAALFWLGPIARLQKRFVTYWNGEASWAELDKELGRSSSATFRNPPSNFARRFSSARGMRIIVRQLAKAMKFASPRICPGAGHMGPVTHADAVGAVIADFIERQESGRKTNPSALRFAA